MFRKSNLLIQILSLGVGLAIGIVLIAKVCFELSYDSFYKDVDRIYCIRSGYEVQGESRDFPQVSGAVAFGFKAEVPGVEEATRMTFYFNSDRYLDEDGNVITGNLRLADSCFFRVFDRPILAGNPEKVLSEPLCLMVSESFAKKMGGVEECIGKIIYNEDVPLLKMTIEGVFKDFPKNGSIDADILLSMESYSKSSTENWVGNDRYVGFVKLQQGVDPQSLNDAIRRMQEAHQPLQEFEKNGMKLWYYLAPFGKTHLKESSVHSMVILLSVIATMLIVISLLNYILITISSMVHRAKEIGVRKCYGANAFSIYGLLARESIIHLLLALVLAAAIIFATKGLIQNLLGVPFGTLLVPQSIWTIVAVLLLVLFVSVFVPAQLYMRIPVSVAFRNYTENSRRWKIGLLGVQVFINVFVVSMLMVIASQYHKMMNDDPGYNYENVLFVDMYDGNQEAQQRVVNVLGQLSEVTHVAASYGLPYIWSNGDNIYLPGDDRELFNVADQYEATAQFYALFGMEFVDGRAPADSNEVVVSESFVKRMNDFTDWSDGAVGKQIMITGHENSLTNLKSFTITGVYRDYRLGSLLDMDTRPSVRFYGSLEDGESYMPHLVFKVNKMDETTIGKLKEAISKALDGKDVQLKVYADEMHSAYEDSRKMRNTVFIGSIFALMIAMLGLIGFIRDESSRRSKEMAIRKINGATERDVLSIFAWGVLKLSLIMSIFACVFAYFVADKWLEQFAEHISLSPLYFIFGATVVLLIVAIVVVMSSIRIARTNPAEALKKE